MSMEDMIAQLAEHYPEIGQKPAAARRILAPLLKRSLEVEFDHLEGRDKLEGVESLTIIHMGIFSSATQIAEFTLNNGTLAMKDRQGRLLGSLSVKP